MIKKIFRSLSTTSYLFSKLIQSYSKKLVVYTKRHPIFTSIFEDTTFDQFVFVCIDIRLPKFSILEQLLISRAVLIHADATAFPNQVIGKKMIVECEGNPADSFFSNPDIKKVLVESKSAGANFLDRNEKVHLCYPSISVNNVVKKKADKPVTILCVGHGGLLKGYDVVYRLFKSLIKSHDIKLIIAGSLGHNYEYYPEITKDTYERSDFEGIQRDLSAHPNVIIRPFKREELLRNVYKDADVFLHLSRMETFGYSILEAMSYGLPVVSCRFKAIEEMVADGESGYLVKSNNYNISTRDYEVNINSKEWADNCYNEALSYLTKLIEDKSLRDHMGKNALKIVEEHFDSNKKKAFLTTMYSDVIAGRE